MSDTPQGPGLGLLSIGATRVFAIVGAAIGLIVLAIGLYDTINIGRTADDAATNVFDIDVSIGVGLIFTDIAAVVIVAGGILAFVQLSRRSPSSSPVV